MSQLDTQNIHVRNITMCFSKQDVKLFDNPNWPLELDNINRNLWNDKYHYVDLEDCKILNPNNYNLVVVQHNIHSLFSNQCDLKNLLNNLSLINSKVDIILLCETHLSKQTVGF